MVEDNPRMNELERMADFCDKYEYIFIYRTECTQKLISKYFHMAGIRIQGFIKPEVYEGDRANEPFPIYNFPEIRKFVLEKGPENIGVIISTDDSVNDQIIETLKMCGVTETFIVSNWNKRTIPKKMQPRSIDDFWVEVNLADHCNLNCQCCDHFSPIATKTFLDFDQYVRDINRISQLTNGELGIMKLQGGEPLLNDRLIDYMRVTREVFPNTLICLFTAGLLLKKWNTEQQETNIWEAIKKYDIEVRLTQYPIALNMDEIVNSAKEHGVPVTFDPPEFKKGCRLWIFSEIGALKYRGEKHSVKHPFDLSGQQEKYRWISCYQFNESIVLRDGKIYTCPMIPYSHYFNEAFNQNLEVKEDCYIDIYKASSYKEIAEFCTHRTSFCDYCAVHKRSVRDWKQSTHDISEWVL